MAYAQDSDYMNALTNFQFGLTIYEKLRNPLKQAQSYYFIGKMYLKIKDFIKANEYYNFALKIAQGIREKELEADILIDMGVILDLQGQYDKCINNYRQVLKIYKRLEKNIEQGEIYLEMGKVLREMGKEYYQEALKNLRYSLKIMIKENQQKGEVDCRTQMGDLLLLLNQPQDALIYYEKAIKKSHVIKDIYREINAYYGKGKVLFELNKFEEAIKIFNNTNNFYQKINHLKGEISCLTYLSNSYDKLGNKDMAKKFKKIVRDKSKNLKEKINLD